MVLFLHQILGGYASDSDGDDDSNGIGCSCGMCGPRIFGLPMFMMDPFYDRDPWANRREKSNLASSRENEALRQFQDVKATVDGVLLEKAKVAVKLGCHPKSQSLLKSLPGVLIENILAMAGLPDVKPRPRLTAQEARGDIDLQNFSIYIPGEKIVIPLTTPDQHLTNPCWRDFSRAVRSNDGWEVKRIAATEQQKMHYREKRKGKVYFINVIFTVPGKTTTKKRAKSASVPSAAKRAKSEDASVVPRAALPATKKANPEEARSALQVAVDSGVNSATGEVDEQSLKVALDAGYSRHFVLASIARVRGDGDQKPAAKKSKHA